MQSKEEKNTDTTGTPYIPKHFTVKDLKDELRKRDLPTTGIQKDLIKRLQRSGYDVKKHNVEEKKLSDESPPKVGTKHKDPYDGGFNMENISSKLELLKLQFEKDALYKVVHGLNQNSALPFNPSDSVKNISYTHMSPEKMVQTINSRLNTFEFDGTGTSFRNWKRQVNSIRDDHHPDEWLMKMVMISKLRGHAMKLYISKEQHINLNVDDLLRLLNDENDRNSYCFKKFCYRNWQTDECFDHYYDDKVRLSKSVLPLPWEELQNYIVLGIPNKNLQHRARMSNWRTKGELVNLVKRQSTYLNQNARWQNRGYRFSQWRGFRNKW